MDQISIDQEPSQKIEVKINPQHENLKQKVRKCLHFLNEITQSNSYEIFMTMLTFLVLYADDLRGISLSKDQDIYFYNLMFVCFWVFFLEILLVSIVRPDYILTFNFWMDVASTLSTLMEIQYVMAWLNLSDISTSGTSQIAKAGRATRVSSRASKAARVVRLIRLVRIAKLYKYAQKQIENKVFGFKNSMMEPRIDKKISKDRFKSEQNEDIQNHVLYNYKMIPKPLLAPDLLSNYVNYDQQSSVRINQDDQNRQQQKLVKPKNKYSTVKVEINRLSIQKERMSSQKEKISDSDCKDKSDRFERSEKSLFVLYEMDCDKKSNRQVKNQSSSHLSLKNDRFQKLDKFPEQESMYDFNNMMEGNQKVFYQECNEILQNENQIQQDEVEQTRRETKQIDESIQETKVGKTLSDLTTKRIIIVMFSVMLSVPLLDVETYYTQYNAYSAMVDTVENELDDIQSNAWLQFLVNFTTSYNQQAGIRILYYTFDNVTVISDPLLNTLRSTEVDTYYTNRVVVIINDKSNTDLNSILSLIRTTFVVIVMVSGAIFFTNDTQKFLVVPIESMLEKVKRICDHPLEVAQIEEEIALAEDQMDKETLEEKRMREKDETQVLENLIVKTGALLAIGFGQAGAEIIAQNLKQQEFNPLIPGRKVFAIWGFCDIRNFLDMNEILEERVMIFVNEIAHIVHSTVHKYEGAVNKNIGDAFLLVWKFPKDVLQYVDDKPQIIDMRMVNNYADMALIAFLKIFFRVRLSLKIARYSEAPEVQIKLPGYTLKMGFGLHVGWAIEGAVGSESKIDASYLSPNVNLASRLEAATKQYGVFVLCSGVFYRLLSKESQSKLRHIDRCTVKGSIQAIDFFTFDIDIMQITIENMPAKRRVNSNKNKNIQKFLRRQKQQARLLKMHKQQFNINSLYNKNDIFTMVQIKYSDEFLNIFHDGINNYLAGQWKNAKRCLNTTKKMIEPYDGPSQTILTYMSKFQYVSPPDWRGYRDLQEK